MSKVPDFHAAARTLRKVIPIASATPLDESDDVMLVCGDGDALARVKGNLALGVTARDVAQALRAAVWMFLVATEGEVKEDAT